MTIDAKNSRPVTMAADQITPVAQSGFTSAKCAPSDSVINVAIKSQL
jgi:hypothetical protein